MLSTSTGRHVAALAFLVTLGGWRSLAAGSDRPPQDKTGGTAVEDSAPGTEAASGIPILRKLVDGQKYREAHRGALRLLEEWSMLPEGEIPDVDGLLWVFKMTVWNGASPLTGPEDDAIDLLVARARRGRGDKDARTVRALVLRSSLLVHVDRYDDARPLLETALRIQEQVPDLPAADMGETLYSLSSLERYRGRTAEAISLTRREIEHLGQLGASGERELAGALLDLTDLWQATGEFAQAKAAVEESLKLAERIFGPGHIYTARALEALAGVYRDLGDFSRAKALSERAVRIWAKTVGEEDGTYASGLDGLALARLGGGTF